MNNKKLHNTLKHIVFSITVLCAATVQSDEIHPFYFANQNPFVQIFGLPRAETASLTNKNTTLSIMTVDIVNNTVKGENESETLVLDGETYRFNMAVKYGLNKNSEIGVDVPIIKHRKGRFDNFIRNWHDVFGLSNDEQYQFEPNQLNYSYQRNQKSLIDIRNSQSGIGDVRITYASRLNPDFFSGAERYVYRLSLKLPTGDADELLGSGGTDVSVTLATDDHAFFKRYYVSLFGQIGMLWLDESDLFHDVQRDMVALGSFAIDWDYWRPLVFKAQLDMHSSFYDSEIVHIGGKSIQLTVGGAIYLNRRNCIDIGVTENLFTDATPDIGLNVSLWISFD